MCIRDRRIADRHDLRAVVAGDDGAGRAVIIRLGPHGRSGLPDHGVIILVDGIGAVSYTHLDVYKRQAQCGLDGGNGSGLGGSVGTCSVNTGLQRGLAGGVQGGGVNHRVNLGGIENTAQNCSGIRSRRSLGRCSRGFGGGSRRSLGPVSYTHLDVYKRQLLPGNRIWFLATGTGFAPFASLLREPETYEKYDSVIMMHTCREVGELEYGRQLVESLKDDPLIEMCIRDRR